MSAVQGLMRNLASDISVCYNQGAPHQIEMDEDTYCFHHDEYPSKWIRYYEALDFGNAFETQTGCGWKKYEIKCENSLFDDDVVEMVNGGQFMVSPYMMESDETVTSQCTINAYFSNYNPNDHAAAMPWATHTFYMSIRF